MTEVDGLSVVFVGGCPRSGTTLLARELARAPDVLVGPETQFISSALERMRGTASPAEVLQMLRRHRRFAPWDDTGDGALDLDDEPRPVAEAVRVATIAVVRRWATTTGRPDATVWVDHTPANVRVFDTLARAFSGAKFIHLVRDPRAVTASVLPLDWGPSDPVAATEWWATHVLAGIALEQRLGTRARRVRFEDLVDAPSTTATELVRWAGSGGDLGPFAAADARRLDRGHHRLLAEPADRERAVAWREALDQRAIELVDRTCGPVLPFLGYEPVGGSTPPPTMREQIGFAARRLARIGAIDPVRRTRRLRRVHRQGST